MNWRKLYNQLWSCKKAEKRKGRRGKGKKDGTERAR